MNFSELQEKLNQEIHHLEFRKEPKELYDPAAYILSLGGKRLRPMLVLLGCELAGGSIEDALKPALALELFHNFTLMHDDIMDNAPLRRNQLTVHKKWNTNVAILSGDLLYTEACRLMLQAPRQVLADILQIFFANAAGVCEGQQWDMNFETTENPSIPEYINMIRLKTAVLLGASLQIGALCGGANKQDSEILYEAGCRFGISFQIQDDLLDVFGHSDTVGKRKAGDILSNKKTFLKLKAMEKADQIKRAELLKWYALHDSESQEKVAAVTKIFEDLHIRDEAETLSRHYFKEGLELISSSGFSEDKKQLLMDFLSTLIDRKS